MLTLLMIFSVSATVKERKFEHHVLPGAPSAGVVKINQSADTKPVINAEFTPVAKKVNKPLKESEQTFEVKCVFKYDRERYRPDMVFIYNADERYDEDYERGDECVYVNVKPGIYNIITMFKRYSSTALYYEEGLAHLILEDIEVNCDIEIELDASLITETISFETYNPDGEKTTLDYVRYLNDLHEVETISEGNVSDFIIQNFISHKDYGYFMVIDNAGGAEVEPGTCGEWKAEWNSNIYVNPVSDKYQFSQARLIYNDKECWFVPMFADGSHTQTVTNKGDKYSDLYNVNFAKTPVGMEGDNVSELPYSISWGLINTLEPLWISNSFSSDVALFHHFRFCQTTSLLRHPQYICMMDFGVEDITTPRFILGMESCNVQPLINNDDLLYLEGGIETGQLLHDKLTFKVTPQSMPVFGSMPQFMQFYYRTYDSPWNEYPYPLLSYESYDYYGDTFTSSDDEIKVSVNGNVVATSKAEIRDWLYASLESPMETGQLVFDYLNNNIEIDGLAGKNSAKVCVDNSVDNFTMPLIQMVQMRDGNNQPAASFSDPTEGSLLITGGDFHKIDGPLNEYGDPLMWYDVYDCDLKVEYAPYGSNDFAPIEMRQEGDMMIGFGYPYIGSLESVDRESATGWFDLRILMTDAAGNTNEQIISPAFKIDRLTGIQQVCVNKANLRIVGRSVVADGGADVEVFTQSGQRVENHNLSAGIYMARSGESVAKLMVK